MSTIYYKIVDSIAYRCQIYPRNLARFEILSPIGYKSDIIPYTKVGETVIVNNITFTQEDLHLMPSDNSRIAVYGTTHEFRTVVKYLQGATFINANVINPGPVDLEIYCCGPKWRRVWESVCIANQNPNVKKMFLHFDFHHNSDLINDIAIATGIKFHSIYPNMHPDAISALKKVVDLR